MIELYDYFRSGAAYRVRIALNLKGLPYRQKPVHLRVGEQRRDDYLAMNPQGLVPTLVDRGTTLTQSLAIMEYLDEAYPETIPLLPADPAGRARARSLALLIAADTHPLNNLRILSWLERECGLDEHGRRRWIHHWFQESFSALEARLAEPATGRFCHGNEPTLADICLAPQMFSAARFGFDVSPYRRVGKAAAAAGELEAFQAAEPARQPDAE